MSSIYPFRALRPRAGDAERIAAVPYDVVTTDEARALADGNPLSFLRVSRPELELAPGADPYADAVYDRAARNFSHLRERALVEEREPSVYFYRLRSGDHAQVGVAACFSLDEYDRGQIKKHERTRADKEDDRTRHMLALGAQTGPVFLTYRTTSDVRDIGVVSDRVMQRDPLLAFRAPDGVEHAIWPVRGAERDTLVAIFERIPALYIADGHHRAASAARARDERRRKPAPQTDGEVNRMLAVAFPHDQVRILPYNRVVKNLGDLSAQQFLEAVGQRFTAGRGPSTPAARGDIAMYFQGGWRTLRPRFRPDPSDPINSLDVSVLQNELLTPVLKIADVRTDKRIDFVGGARGVEALEQAVNSGEAAVAFSLFPVSVSDLMSVSDAGEIMPPKSTWFEPKLRDGLLIHLI
jgi:uncharacterized protein (DUF1015 family)